MVSAQARTNREGRGRKGIWRKKMRDEGGGLLISLDVLAPRPVSVCLPLISSLAPYKVQKKISSGTGSSRLSQKNGRKTVVCA